MKNKKQKKGALADPFSSHPVAHILHIQQTHDLMVSKF